MGFQLEVKAYLWSKLFLEAPPAPSSLLWWTPLKSHPSTPQTGRQICSPTVFSHQVFSHWVFSHWVFSHRVFNQLCLATECLVTGCCRHYWSRTWWPSLVSLPPPGRAVCQHQMMVTATNSSELAGSHVPPPHVAPGTVWKICDQSFHQFTLVDLLLRLYWTTSATSNLPVSKRWCPCNSKLTSKLF